MDLPTIQFKYSPIYDENWKEWIKVYGWKDDVNLTPTQLKEKIIKIERLWKRYDKDILNELSKITGLRWQDKTITCYIVGKCRPFSDPLTIPAYKDNNRFIDVLVHELIHQLFTQRCNLKKSKEALNYFFTKYKDESRRTIIHIPIHAIHSHIYLKFFDRKRMENDIEFCKRSAEYEKSWKIVQEEGYQKIIDDFTKRVP